MFIQFDSNDKVIGKCALGALACESSDESLHLDINHIQIWDEFDKLFKSYGVENLDGLPYLKHNGDFDFDFHGYRQNLSGIIMMLNDTHGFTFKQIADFLEVTFDL